MTERAYYRDAYTAGFSATIVDTTSHNSRPAVILDRSYFYPTSGGQPHDTGRLESGEQSAQVLEVIERESDKAVLHILEKSLDPGNVRGQIDWPRRFDHMQHHTGQHILSQAFLRLLDAETISFHLSDQSVTIDLDRPEVPTDDLHAVERLANQVIWEDRPVSIREVSRTEVAGLQLRKIPPGRDGSLRLVEIEDFDLTACGGTHVARTGAVGAIKVIKTERRGASIRIEFCCGRRAFEDYHQKHEVITQLSSELTTGHAELVMSVSRMREDIRQLQSRLKRQQTAVAEAEARQLMTRSIDFGSWRLIRQVFTDREVDDIRLLANILTKNKAVVVFLGLAGERGQLLFCRSADGPGIMGDLIRPALERLGSARGGGGPTLAQGGGPPADVALINQAIDVAEARLREAANGIE